MQAASQGRDAERLAKDLDAMILLKVQLERQVGHMAVVAHPGYELV
jgi:hypothetical protein